MGVNPVSGVVVVRKLLRYKEIARQFLNTIVGLLFFISGTGFAADYYFDVNGATTGFGSPSGTYSQNDPLWNTSSAGDAVPVALSAGNILIFGASASDLQGSTFTINMNGTQMSFDGITVNSTNAGITFTGSANLYLGNNQTWTVARGAVFTEAHTWNGGMNFDNTLLLLTGGGVINFMTSIGCNSGSRITQDDAGGGLTVNLHAGRSTNTACTGGYTLMGGNLNLANGNATNAFGTGSVILSGGTLDNTSGFLMKLCDMSSYTFGGSFIFRGSSSLDLGTSNVTLSASPVITVNSNTFAISGVISGAYNLLKSGAGILALNGTNIYSGTTVVSNGVLLVNGSVTGSVTVSSGGVLGGTGAVNAATLVQSGGVLNAGNTNATGTLAVNANLSLNGQWNVDINSAGQGDMVQGIKTLDISSCNLNINVMDEISGGDYVIAAYETLAGSRFASVVNLPGNYTVSYNYNGEKKIALALQRGTVITLR